MTTLSSSPLLSAVDHAQQQGWSDAVSEEIADAEKSASVNDLVEAANRLSQLCPRPDTKSLTTSSCRTVVERLSIRGEVNRHANDFQNTYEGARFRDRTLEATVTVHVQLNDQGVPINVRADLQRLGPHRKVQSHSQRQAERVLREDITKIFTDMTFPNLAGTPLSFEFPLNFSFPLDYERSQKGR